MNLLALPLFAGNGPERLLLALGRGSLEVILLSGLVWLACRAFPRLPAQTRFWLWWLCCIKGLTAVAASLSGATLPLPITLPAVSAPVLLTTPLPHVTSPHRPITGSHSPDLSDADDEAPDTASAAAPTLVEPPPAPPVTVPLLYTLGTIFYGSGVVFVLLVTLAQSGCAFVLRRRTEPCRDQAVLDAVRAAAKASKLRATPTVAVSPLTRSPLVVGNLRPVLILPRDFAATLTPDGLRLALLHEMAHIRRGDLLLTGVPLALRTVLFFLPPVYLICREVEQAREEACDAAAVSTAGCGGAEYGRLLLAVSHQAGRGRIVPVGGMHMAAVPFRHLKRRLLAVQQASRPVSRGVRLTASLLVVVMATFSLPWQGLEQAEATPLPLSADGPDDDLPRYEIVPLSDLGEHYSGTYSDALAISDNGQIVGTAGLRDGGGRGHAYRLQTAQKRVIDPSAGSEFGRSQAVDVNDDGLMVVSAFNRWSRPRTFVWDGQRRYIETVRGYRYSEAAGINEAGQVAATATRGRRINGVLPCRAYIWRNGRVRLLSTLGGPFSRAHAINEAGWVAGKADLPRAVGEVGVTHACVWDDSGQAHDLGTLPGGDNSAARAVSPSGAVVGFSEVEDGIHAFRADDGGRGALQDLGGLPGYTHSTAWGVADTSEGEVIVGAATANRDGGDSRAVLWQSRAVLWQSRAVLWQSRAVLWQSRAGIDLNRCIAPGTGWTLEVARAINTRGEIVGQGRIGGRAQAFLLRPVAD